MNAKVTTTTVTHPKNEILGTEEKKLHYVVIATTTGKTAINVGEKTLKNVLDLLNPKEVKK